MNSKENLKRSPIPTAASKFKSLEKKSNSINTNRNLSSKTWKAFEFINTDAVFQKVKEKILELAIEGPPSDKDSPIDSPKKQAVKPSFSRSNSSGVVVKGSSPEEFDCSRISLSSIPTEIEQLYWIKILNFECNQLSSVPKQICSLIALELLNLGDNRITYLPEEIGELTKLRKLILSNNQLQTIPVTIGKLYSLQELYLANNKLKFLPVEMSACKELTVLNLENNSTLIFPPSSIRDQGIKEIFNLFREIINNSSQKPLKGKLVLLGPEKSGKTTLLSLLRKASKQKSKSETNNLVGVSINPWKYESKVLKQAITFSTWDFSGNRIFDTTHQFFFSDRTVYLLVFDLANKSSHLPVVEYWLNSIEGRIKNSFVIVVGTHEDDKQFEVQGALDELLNQIQSRLQPHKTYVQELLAVSCTNGTGIDYLREKIEKIVLEKKLIREEVPLSFVVLEEILMNQQKINPILSWSTVSEYASMCKISQSQEEEAVRYLYNLGSLAYWNDRRKKNKNFIILDPQWVYEGIGHLIHNEGNVIKKGVLHNKDLDKLFPNYPLSFHSQFLSLLESCQIAFPLPRQDEREELVSVIHALLPEKISNLDLGPIDVKRLVRQFHFAFIPYGLFGRLIASLLQTHFSLTGTISDSFWKEGVVIRDNDGNTALVERSRSIKKSINISVRGAKNPETLLRIITTTLRLLIRNWFSVQYKTYVACSHCIKAQQEAEKLLLLHNSPLGDDSMPLPYFFDEEECEKVILENQTPLKCRGVINVSLDELVPDLLLNDKSSLKFQFSDLKIVKQLGSGAFGIIYEALLNNELVAVKQLTITNPETVLDSFRDWGHEVNVMSKLKHPKLVSLKGFSIDPFSIIMGYVPCGTLYDFIHNETQLLDSNLIIKIASDIAEALNYMHQQSPVIIHRDVKTPNILLASVSYQDQVTAVLADFGLTTPSYISEFTEKAVDQPSWLAPEVILHRTYTEKVDIYAFGIILWELFSRKHPFEEFPFFSWPAQLEDAIIEGCRPTIPENCPEAFKRLIQSCWNFSPEQRPACSSILQTLNTLVSSEAHLEDGLNQRYHFDLPDTEETIVKEEVRDVIQCANLYKYIERFSLLKYREDAKYMKEFILTHSMFTTSSELYRIIRERYLGPQENRSTEEQRKFFQKEGSSIRTNILRFVRKWIRRIDYLDEEIYNNLSTFIFTCVNDKPSIPPSPRDREIDSPSTRLERQFLTPEEKRGSSGNNERRLGKTSSLTAEAFAERKKLIDLLNKRKKLDSEPVVIPHRKLSNIEAGSLQDISVEDYVKQSTLLECLYFKKLKVSEFLGQAWNKEGKEEKAPNILAWMEWFNLSRDFISTEILKEESPVLRASLIEKCIQIGQKYYEYHNYSGLIQILSSLHSEAISSLGLSWKDVSRKSAEILEQLSQFMNPAHDFAVHREQLKQHFKDNISHIPYLAIYLTDFIYYDEIDSWFKDGLINFNKIKTIGGIMNSFQDSQKLASYDFPVNEKIREFILTAEIWEPQQLLRLAQMREEMDNISSPDSYSVRLGLNYVGGRSNIATDIEHLGEREWTIIMSNSTPLKWAKDQIVFKEGDQNSFLYRVKKGRFRVEKNGHILNKVETGAMFGEMSFLGTHTSASIFCDEEASELWVLEISLARKLFASDPDLFRTFYQYIATILARRLKNYSSPNLHQRPRPLVKQLSSNSPKQKNLDDDTRLRKRFKLDNGEILIKDYPCSQGRYNGKMYLTKNTVCFYSKFFGVKKKKSFPFTSIKSFSKKDKCDIELLFTSNKKERFTFDSTKERDEANSVAESLWSGAQQSTILKNALDDSVERKTEGDVDTESLTPEDWEFLLQGIKPKTFEYNRTIVSEGQYFQRIYQIAKGQCRVEKFGTEIGKLDAGSMFGEISFLLSGGATASVIADTDFVDVYILEGFFINILFQRRPELAGRFYKYLAVKLQQRIRVLEDKKKTEEEEEKQQDSD